MLEIITILLKWIDDWEQSCVGFFNILVKNETLLRLLITLFIFMFYDLAKGEKHPGLVFLLSFIKLLVVNVVGYIMLGSGGGSIGLGFNDFESSILYPSIFLYLIGLPLLVSYAIKKNRVI